MNFSGVKELMLQKFREELPAYLTYHNLAHVLDVLKSTEAIAKSEGVDNEQLTLLLTGALFHDAGFLIGPEDHETASCQIVQSILPGFDYDQNQIDIIEGIIMATKIPQTPHTLLEQIIGDADLDYLGRDDFFTIGNGLYAELKHFGVVSNLTEWNSIQEKFLATHRYHTYTAITSRKEKKRQHLESIRKALGR